MDRPRFGTKEIYESLANVLNDDPVWLKKAAVLNYSMTHVYEGSPKKVFGFRFEGGKLLDVRESDEIIPADFVLSASPEIWQRILVDQTLTPQVGIVSRKLGVQGSISALLKNISVFNYLLNALIELQPAMPDEEE